MLFTEPKHNFEAVQSWSVDVLGESQSHRRLEVTWRRLVHPHLRCDAQLCLLLAHPPTLQTADAEKSNRQAIHRSLSSLGFGLGRFSTQEFTLILSKCFALTKGRAQA